MPRVWHLAKRRDLTIGYFWEDLACLKRDAEQVPDGTAERYNVVCELLAGRLLVFDCVLADLSGLQL